MTEKLIPTDRNNASVFNSIAFDISALNTANKALIESQIVSANNLLTSLTNEETLIRNRISQLRTLLTAQQSALNLNAVSRGLMTSIESDIPTRNSEYAATVLESQRLTTVTSQYVVGTTVLPFNSTLSELVSLGKVNGKVIAVNSSGRLYYTDSPSGTDRSACACFTVQFPPGTTGQAIAADIWTEVQFNTTHKSERGITLSGGRISLPPGSYTIWGYGVASSCSRFRARLRNVTSNTEVVRGSACANIPPGSGDQFNGVSYYDASFSISSTTLYTMDLMPESAGNAGLPCNFQGIPENYGSIVIVRW